MTSDPTHHLGLWWARAHADQQQHRQLYVHFQSRVRAARAPYNTLRITTGASVARQAPIARPLGKGTAPFRPQYPRQALATTAALSSAQARGPSQDRPHIAPFAPFLRTRPTGITSAAQFQSRQSREPDASEIRIMLTGRARPPARRCRACSEEVNFLAGPTPANSCSARTSSGRPGAGSAPRLEVISRSGSWIGPPRARA